MGNRRSGQNGTYPRTLIWPSGFRSLASTRLGVPSRSQLKSYIIRWATYSQGRFKEGVSLTVHHELDQWRKYAYGSIATAGVATVDVVAGCNELVFNPLLRWDLSRSSFASSSGRMSLSTT